MFRHVLVLLLLSCLPLGARQASCGSYAEAVDSAQREGKIIYVLITAPGCRWCKKFKNTTLADTKVLERLSRIAVEIEVMRGSGLYPEKLKAPMVPMHYFLAPDETVLVKMPGYWGIEDFMSILDDVERKRK